MKCNIKFDGKNPAYCNTHKRNFGICVELCDIKTKGQAQQYAINYQNMASENNLSYSEIFSYQNKLLFLAKKFHLIKEFKENGLI